MTPAGHRARVHVTLTDDHPWAMAVVVIEALPLSSPEARLLPGAEIPAPGRLSRGRQAFVGRFEHDSNINGLAEYSL